jgi:hypothetical protein
VETISGTVLIWRLSAEVRGNLDEVALTDLHALRAERQRVEAACDAGASG